MSFQRKKSSPNYWLLVPIALFSGVCDAQLITANRVYHHSSGRKFQIVYGSPVLDSQLDSVSLYRLNEPDADQSEILSSSREALDIWLDMYKTDGFLVPGQDDELIADYRSHRRLDQHRDFMIVNELLGERFDRRKLIGFWGVAGPEGMENEFNISIHRRPISLMTIEESFLPVHWRVEPNRYFNVRPFFVWNGGNPMEHGPVWADSDYPWVFSFMLHNGHWDAGITTTEQTVVKLRRLRRAILGPGIVMPSDFINWSAPRNGKTSRARLFRERLYHDPLNIDGSPSIEWRGKELELSTIHVGTYLHHLALELRHPAFVDFIGQARPGALHLGLRPRLILPTHDEWAEPGVVVTALDRIRGGDGDQSEVCSRLLTLMSQSILVEGIHPGPGLARYKEELIVLPDRRAVFVPLYGSRRPVGPGSRFLDR